jgi:outer membrane protein assembly factor BamA
MKNIYVLILLLGLSQSELCAQDTADTLAKQKKYRLLALPVVFYTPDTKLGLGAGGIVTWQTPGARYPNSINFSGAWTVRKQLLFWFPFQVYSRDTRWQTYGEAGYFRYIFDYFGIGNGSRNEDREKYDATFPRVRFNGLRSVISNKHFAGIRYYFDGYRIDRLDSLAQLIQERPLGVAGGTTSGLGLVWLTDTRDKRFYPRKGVYGEFVVYHEGRETGSDFGFTRYHLDVAKYFAFGKKHTLAANTAITLTQGDVPFYNMATIGGTKRLRGYIEGRFRDKNVALIQTEWRTKFTKRFGGVVFGGTGMVWDAPGTAWQLRPNYGFGIRFTLDTAQHLNIRGDYGFGSRGNRGFYLTIGEAF